MSEKPQLSDDVQGRLFNWKFKSAWDHYLSEHDGKVDLDRDSVGELIEAMSSTFGNIGWVGDGTVSVIIGAIVDVLVPREDEGVYKNE